MDSIFDWIFLFTDIPDPSEYTNISGYYILKKPIVGYEVGNLYDSQDGRVHGIWDTTYKTTRYFSDTDWFEKEEEVPIEPLPNEIISKLKTIFI